MRSAELKHRSGSTRGRASCWEWLAVCTLVGLWSLAVGWLAVSRHLALHTGFDLGVFAQVVWATGQGQPFYTSLIDETASFLGYHFTPILAVLVPFYSLWPDARLLLVVQTIALAAGAIPLFAFSRPRLGLGQAFLVILAYFLFPPLHFVALFEFHAVALSVPLLMAAGAALLNERPRATLIWLGLSLLVKEEMVLIAVGFGLYALLIQRRKRFGAALALGATLWAVLLFGLVMPALGQVDGSYTFVRRYQSLGDTPGEVIRTLVTRPAEVVSAVATRAKATFLWQILAPLAGLPLLGLPAALLTLPTLAYLLLSDYQFQVSIQYHYTAPLLPFLFLATVIALQRMAHRNFRLGRIASFVLLLASLVSAWWWSPLPGGRAYEPTDYVVSEEAQAIRTLMASIPPNAAVVADWAYLPWLANRWQIDMPLVPPYQRTAPHTPPAYLLTRKPGPGEVSAPAYPWILEKRSIAEVRVPRFVPLDNTPGGVVLSKWSGPEQGVVLHRYDVPFERGLELVAAGLPPGAPAWGPEVQVEPGTTLPIWLAWGARKRLEQRITFTLHLVDGGGQRVAQVDREMRGGHFPTTLWHQWLDEPVVADEFLLSVAPDVPPGRYHLLAGAYESEKVVALTRPNGDPWFELATVVVRPPGP